MDLSSDGETNLMRLFSSRDKGELLTLFHRNPGLMDDVNGIARRIGRSNSGIQKDLDDLIDMGVLGTIQVGSTRVVFLDRAKDKEMLETVSTHLGSMRK